MAAARRSIHRSCVNVIACIASAAAVLVLQALFTPQGDKIMQCELHAKSVGSYIPVQELGQWDVIDERTLLIWVPGTARAHLVRLSKAVPMLRQIEELSVVGGGPEHIILPCGRDAVELEDASRTRAAITEIEPISAAQAAELLRKLSSQVGI